MQQRHHDKLSEDVRASFRALGIRCRHDAPLASVVLLLWSFRASLTLWYWNHPDQPRQRQSNCGTSTANGFQTLLDMNDIPAGKSSHLSTSPLPRHHRLSQHSHQTSSSIAFLLPANHLNSATVLHRWGALVVDKTSPSPVFDHPTAIDFDSPTIGVNVHFGQDHRNRMFCRCAIVALHGSGDYYRHKDCGNAQRYNADLLATFIGSGAPRRISSAVINARPRRNATHRRTNTNSIVEIFRTSILSPIDILMLMSVGPINMLLS